MYQLFFTPSWFNGWDIAFEAIGLIIALMIASYSWRVYRFSHENKHMYFSLAFITIAISLMAKMFAFGVLYFQPLRDNVLMVLQPAVGTELQFADLFYRAAFFIQMVLMLGAWLLIFFISQKSRERFKKFHEISQIVLFIYLIFLISFVSNFKYFVFYLTGTVILGLTVLNYYQNYLNSGNEKTKLVMAGFALILLSSISFIFVFLFESFYVLGELFLLMGFLLLLYTYRSIMRR